MKQRLISIVAPEGYEHAVTTDLQATGVTAWTAWTVRGAGEHGKRPSQWRGPNVRIDLVVDPELAGAVVAMLARKHPRTQGIFVAVTEAWAPTLELALG